MSAKEIKALVDIGTTMGYSGDVADLMTWGSLFQTEAAAATKVWSLIEESRAAEMASMDNAAERRYHIHRAKLEDRSCMKLTCRETTTELE